MSIGYNMYQGFRDHLNKKILKAREENNFKKAYNYQTIQNNAADKYTEILTKERDRLVEFGRDLRESDYGSHSLIYVQAVAIWSDIRVTMQVFWNVIIKKGK